MNVERSIKRQCCADPTADPYDVSVLISNMYQRTFDLPPKRLSFYRSDSNNATTLFPTLQSSARKHKPSTSSSSTTLYNKQQGLPDTNKNASPQASPSHVSKDSTSSLDELLGQLEALDLSESSPRKVEPSPTFQLRTQTIETKRTAFQVRDTLDDKQYFGDIDALYDRIAIPIPKGVLALTDDEDRLVDSILRKPQSGMVSQFKTAVVEFKDMYMLYPGTWLNDEIINFYMVLLMDRAANSSNSNAFPAIHCFNTFFCSTLREQGYDKVKRWTKKVDIFAKDLLLIPINQSYHWTLGVIDLKKKQVFVYDSLNGKHHTGVIQLLLQYLELEHLDKKKTPFDTSDWQGIMPSSIPQQNNSSDCGVFACTFAERLARNQKFDFSQDDMVSIRRRMVLDIKQKKLST